MYYRSINLNIEKNRSNPIVQTITIYLEYRNYNKLKINISDKNLRY